MNAVTGAHLIGSVPLPDAETVFRTVARELGPYLARMPDGETGNRIRWIWWQRDMLLRHPAMEPDPETPPFEVRQWDGALLRTTDWLRLKAGVDPATVNFDTGYAAAARDSYAIFRRLRDAGEIPAGMRFQVCLPTPMASGYMYVSPASLAAYLPVYERSLLAALREITDCDPASRSLDPVGCLPGGPGVRALLPAQPTQLQDGHRRRTCPAGRRGAQ